MTFDDLTPDIIGKRVRCIENGYEVNGTITAIVENDFEKGVHVQFDKPLRCWSGDFNTEEWTEVGYDSLKAKYGVFDNLQYTHLIP